jgi:hypothetical protein
MEGWRAYGKGAMKFASGDVFECTFIDGYANGQGAVKYANGDIFEGEYEDGYPIGKGVKKYANGDVFECTFIDGYANGQGAVKYEVGYRIGKGVKKFARGDELECEEWNIDELADGKGVLKLANRNMIDGVWKDGELQSGARYIRSDGKVFVMKEEN